MDNDEYIDLSSIDTISITSPNNISTGDIWIDTTTMNTNVFSISSDWITLTSDDNINLDDIIIYEPIEFEDEMPGVAKVENMCKDYPALEKAYENFKTIYKLVHQDWVGRQKEED